ncbi:TPA: DUF4214 domain-containing protein [Klebsiella aerogenes]|nr:DUF4214 domain-containing protein [Klebsiella quasipneumoniae]HCM2944344.1 DUF4214 domain-containing protein [Klebsiella quasipneumoniae subsp. similipneumoniae]HCM6336366.1 DUF4214 domain-containing protein [Klebsiella quasipneumoniae subsp. similipneumoniae]HDU4418993.1 DUF4214 domain-containing protein [Klebsiella aerogenes]HDU4903407.1 DUF4214 domain-containing protein [Klebsiella quasipneumoniae subsp. similipneumoniae]
MDIQYKLSALRFITNSYVDILGRQADKDGALNYLHLFETETFANASRLVTKSLINSDEFKNKNQSHQGSLFIHGTDLINGKEVKNIIPLGSHCLAASILKKYNLKKHSYPFDWIFSSPGVVYECLCDDFKTFMDKQHHISITGNRINNSPEQGATHKYFESKYGTKEFFTHRDITLKENYEYYERTINRFLNALSSDDGKVFIIISRGQHDLTSNFDKISTKLNEKTKNFHLIAVQLVHTRTESFPLSLKVLKSKPNSTLYEFSSESVEEFRGSYPSVTDEMIILSLLSKFKFSL